MVVVVVGVVVVRTYDFDARVYPCTPLDALCLCGHNLPTLHLCVQGPKNLPKNLAIHHRIRSPLPPGNPWKYEYPLSDRAEH